MARYVGRSVPRVEDRRFLTGRGRYTDDVAWEGQLVCAFLRSPHAHARIARIDAAEALKAPGVCAVLTGADYVADGLEGVQHAPNPADPVEQSAKVFVAPPGERIVELPHWPLALGRVRHVGEPLAVVVAQTAAAARDATERIEVDYEPLPAVVSPIAALAKGAPQLFDEVPGNLCFSLGFGDAVATRRALDSAPLVVRHRFAHNRVTSSPMEPRSALGHYDAATGMHTLLSCSQGVHGQKMVLSRALKLAPESVRVISPDVGGGFGSRTSLYPEQVVVVWAAKRLGRPVKWTGERSEAFLSDYQGRESVVQAALALDPDGRILGYELEWFANQGSGTVSFVSLANSRRMLSTVYDIPVAHFRSNAVLTNTVPTAPYRGTGRPESVHMIERLLDMAARRLGLDRVEIRRRNLVRKQMLPYRNVMGVVYDSGDFPGYMEQAVAAADWNAFERRRSEARARGRWAGIGVANHISFPVGAPFERVSMRVSGEETVDVVVGTQSTGQGHETSYAQVVADSLGVPMACVRIRYGDTEFVSLGGGTHSERSMRIAGTLIVQASGEIVEQGKAAAAAMLEAAAEDLVFEDGCYRIAGTDRGVGLFEAARAVESGAGSARALAVTRDFKGRINAFPAGAAVCELEVDPDTGAVDITRYTTVDDSGQPINPAIVEAQTHGGIAQGVGQALLEGMVFDAESGQALTGSYADYGLCRADSLPPFAVELAEDPTSGNPLRVKGGGEAGIMPATAAVVNALCDALSQAGVEDLQMPATPGAIWSAIGNRA